MNCEQYAKGCKFCLLFFFLAVDRRRETGYNTGVNDIMI
ncbi:hypothetical protein QSI_2856 [Clostridioides difficile P28]|nr:hypothetical protein QSI_2856 [Clostridioides difficile P28]